MELLKLITIRLSTLSGCLAGMVILLASCTSTVMAAFDAIDPASLGMVVAREKPLQSPDGSFVLYAAKNRQGQPQLWVECRRNAGMVLIAPLQEDLIHALFQNQAGGELNGNFETLYQFMNWDNGWSEYEQNVIGKFKLSYTSEGWHFQLAGPLELADLKNAAIRAGDKTWRGDRALGLMRNRSNRIDAVVSFIADKLPEVSDPSQEAWSRDKSWFIPAFKQQLQALLVPEMVDPANRPPTWKEPIKRSDYAESVVWSRDYSESVFPKELVEIRQSGTILRDWEESTPLIYGRWRWPGTIALLSAGFLVHAP